MNENKTTSILQRVPRILAVTAASYGLAQRSQGNTTQDNVRKDHAGAASKATQGKPH